MKTLTMSALAFAGLALVGSTAQAASYTAGDLLLGFRATGGTGASTNYVLNLGQASSFRDATTNTPLTLGGVGVDLTLIYGPTWFSRADLFWGVIGGSSTTGTTGGTNNIFDIANTVYASAAQTVFGTQANPWIKTSNGTTGPITTGISSTAAAYVAGATSYDPGTGSVPLSSPVGTAEVQGGSSWATKQYGFGGNTTAFTYFPIPGIEGNFASGVASAALDLFRLQRSGAADQETGVVGVAGSTPGTYEGTFTISNVGQVTYSAAPEPTTLSILALGGVLCAGLRPRRQKQTVA